MWPRRFVRFFGRNDKWSAKRTLGQKLFYSYKRVEYNFNWNLFLFQLSLGSIFKLGLSHRFRFQTCQTQSTVPTDKNGHAQHGPLAIYYFFFQKYLLIRRLTLGWFLTVFAIETLEFHGNNPAQSDFDIFTAAISRQDAYLVVDVKLP